MKRLLEWKQKMLQSPLNRKVHQSKGFISRSDYYKSQDEYAQRMQENMYPSRRTTNMVCQYSSYSSDDEGKSTFRTSPHFKKKIMYIIIIYYLS